MVYDKDPLFCSDDHRRVQLSVNNARNYFLQAQSSSLSIVVTVGMQDEIVAQNACSTTREKKKGLVEASHQA